MLKPYFSFIINFATRNERQQNNPTTGQYHLINIDDVIRNFGSVKRDFNYVTELLATS